MPWGHTWEQDIKTANRLAVQYMTACLEPVVQQMLLVLADDKLTEFH